MVAEENKLCGNGQPTYTGRNIKLMAAYKIFIQQEPSSEVTNPSSTGGCSMPARDINYFVENIIYVSRTDHNRPQYQKAAI